jgi:hypothetical protein
LGIAPTPARGNATNKVSINLFILQHIGQLVDDAGEHHTIDECDGQNTYSPSEEGLPQMDQMEYRRMVVEAQIVVDVAKDI